MKSQRGQALLELAFQIPVMLLLLFGGVQVGRIFYTYHTLQKALRGGAGMLARSSNVAYCDPNEMLLADARNFIVYGRLEGGGSPVVSGLTPDLIQIVPERQIVDSTSVTTCTCGGGSEPDPESCEPAPDGRPPDFVVVHLGSGFPLSVPVPFVNFPTINLRVSVRMPVTGG